MHVCAYIFPLLSCMYIDLRFVFLIHPPEDHSVRVHRAPYFFENILNNSTKGSIFYSLLRYLKISIAGLLDKCSGQFFQNEVL